MIKKTTRKISIILIGLFYSFSPVQAQNAFFNVSDKFVKKLVNNTDDEISKVIGARYLKPTLKIKNNAGSVKLFGINTEGSTLAIGLSDNTIRVWDLELGIQKTVINNIKSNIQRILVTKNGEYLIYSNAEGEITVIDVLTKDQVSNYQMSSGQLVDLIPTSDETKLLLVSTTGDIVAWDWKNSKIEKLGNCNPGTIVDFTVDHDSLVLASKNQIKNFSLNAKECSETKAEFDNDIKEIIYHKNTGLLYVSLTDGSLYQGKSGSSSFNKSLLNTNDKTFMSDYGNLVLQINSENNLSVYDLITGSLKKNLPSNEKSVVDVVFIPGNKFIVTGDKEGITTFWEISSAKPLVRMIHTLDGWSVIDNRGRFDGSEAAIANVFWETEENELNLSQFSRQYFESGLLTTYLHSEESFITTAPVVVDQGVMPPPTVQIDLELADKQLDSLEPFYVVVVAEDMGGGIANLQLFHNGKLMPPGSLLKKEDHVNEEEKKHILAGVFYVQPVSGPNTFKALATNLMGIESESSIMTKTFASDGIKPDLHVFTVGLNSYKDPFLNLDYSVPDAKAILNQFKLEKDFGFNKIHFKTLFNQQGTKKNIINEFEKLAEIPSSDVVIFYYAGHGLFLDDDWYLMPYETQMTKQNDKLKHTGLSAKKIQKLLVNIKAQRIMVMIDACYSGGGVESFHKFQHFQRRFSRIISREVGVTVLAATRKDQNAAELGDLKHGLFTYVVLNGLKGQADNKPMDKVVTAHEVVNYSSQTIPSYSRQYVNASQEPSAYAIGADFTLINRADW